MSIPIRPGAGNVRQYVHRGFPAVTYRVQGTTGPTVADMVHSEYVCLGLPAPLPKFAIGCATPPGQPEDGWMSVGHPPFDRQFAVWSADVAFLRGFMSPGLIGWLLDSDWPSLVRSRDYPGGIGLGPEHIQMVRSRNTAPEIAAELMDFMIEFLRHTPPEIWPVPLPREGPAS